MLKALPLFAAVALASSLAACNSEPETIIAGPVDPMAEQMKNAAPVTLPPSILASRTYRCKDNSLVYIDFLSNNTAVFKATKDAATGTTLTAPAEGQAYTAEGYSVSANAETIDLTAPGKGAQSCKA